jgi:hypothetical protein
VPAAKKVAVKKPTAKKAVKAFTPKAAAMPKAPATPKAASAAAKAASAAAKAASAAAKAARAKAARRIAELEANRGKPLKNPVFNAETMEAIHDTLERRNLIRSESLEELFEDLGI